MFDKKHGELVRRINACTRRLDDLVAPEVSPGLVGPLLALPMLRGAWIASVDSGGDWYDVSGHGHHLTYNGDPTHAYDGVAPYWDYDGTGDYHHRPDEADLDISGTETYVAAAYRGLTWGGWFYPEETGTIEDLFSKWSAAAGQYSYRLYLDASDQINARFSDDGTNSDVATSSVVSMNAWYFVVGRVDPSATVAVFVGSPTGLEATGQATARASVFNSTSDLCIAARHGGTAPFNGRAACCFLCAASLTTGIISSVFNQTKGAFRV
jgi:hypothetical protein